jgi:hypothetical protein
MSASEKALESFGPHTDDFLLAEYKALRAEILALEERGTNIQIAGLTGIPTLLAAGEYFRFSFLIIFGPVIILVASMMVIFIQDSIMRNGAYIKDRVESHFFNTARGGWEHFLEEHEEPKHENRRAVEKHTRMSVVVAFAFYYMGATALAYTQTLATTITYAQYSRYAHHIALSLALIYAIAFCWTTSFILKNFPKGTGSPHKNH